MAGPMLLTYNLDSFTDSKLRVLCKTLHMRYRAVTPEEYALPVGALAGLPAKAAPETGVEPFDDPMLVMCHLLNTQLNAFLQGMREAGIRPVALKAVLTPTNVAWNSRQLRDELSREHEAVRRRS